MHTVLAQDTEVVSKAKRRSFTAKYKHDVLKEAAGCKKPGEIGALLRREGLYSSHLTSRRREMEERGLAGLARKKRGPKVTPPKPGGTGESVGCAERTLSSPLEPNAPKPSSSYKKKWLRCWG